MECNDGFPKATLIEQSNMPKNPTFGMFNLPDLFQVIFSKFSEPQIPMMSMYENKSNHCRNER